MKLLRRRASLINGVSSVPDAYTTVNTSPGNVNRLELELYAYKVSMKYVQINETHPRLNAHSCTGRARSVVSVVAVSKGNTNGFAIGLDIKSTGFACSVFKTYKDIVQSISTRGHCERSGCSIIAFSNVDLYDGKNDNNPHWYRRLLTKMCNKSGGAIQFKFRQSGVNFLHYVTNIFHGFV